MTTNSSAAANRQIARAAGTVMAAFVLSNIVGLVRQVLVSRAFGTTGPMDAFNAAITIPDVLFNLMAGGALASAFLPTFTGFLAKENREGAWKLASAVTNLASLALAFTSALAALFAPALVRYVLFALDHEATPALLDMTTDLLRIILIAPTIFGVSGMVMSILNAHQKFWLPALAPVFYWIGWILGLVFFVPTMGIYGLAWGYVLGAFLHLAIQLPDLVKLAGRRYSATLGIGNPAVGEVARLMAPRLLGVAAVQLNFVINTMVAASLGAGSLSAIKVAIMVMTMPLFAIAQSIATAALPTFSAQVARGEIDEMRASLASTLRGILLLAIPATVGLILLRQPVVIMLFQRGAFDATSTELTAWALLWYTAGLVGHSVVEILSRAFYALHDTKTPVIVGTAAMALNAVFSFIFPGMFASAGWLPLGGLALANSLATALEATILVLLMRRRLKGLNGADIAKGVGQFTLAALGMALGLLFWIKSFGSLNPWLVGLGGVAAGGLVYGLGVVLLKVPEIQSVIGFLKRRIRHT
ncbi:MAG: murein biosynthesis integral membrane protein MurJ [Anaerolineales bacterium]